MAATHYPVFFDVVSMNAKPVGICRMETCQFKGMFHCFDHQCKWNYCSLHAKHKHAVCQMCLSRYATCKIIVTNLLTCDVCEQYIRFTRSCFRCGYYRGDNDGLFCRGCSQMTPCIMQQK